MTNITDTRNGLTFDIADYSPAPTAVALTISNRVDAAGTFTLVIDETTWSVVDTDPELDINAEVCVGFSGRIKISFPARHQHTDDSIIFLLFLVRSDGVIN